MEGNDRRRPLHLRLPVSLVASLDTRRRGQGRGAPQLQIRHDSGQPVSLDVRDEVVGKETKAYPLQTTEQTKHTTWFNSSSGDDAAVNSQNDVRLRRIGDTARTLSVDPHSAEADDHLKRMGKMARQRLENERKKRKEIVLLEDDEDIDLQASLPEKKQQKRASKRQALAEQLTAPATAEKTQSDPKKTAKLKRRRLGPNVDGWSPNADQSSGPKDRSDVIRVHGLPVNVKPEQIRKFFDGLDPTGIFVLPPFDKPIQSWDVSDDTSITGLPKVKRHGATIRIFVQFTSVLVADAALIRSGEFISVTKDADVCSDDRVDSASISLSPVAKHLAKFIINHMAVDARKGEEIRTTLNNAANRLGSVTTIVWQMTIKKLAIEDQVEPSGRQKKDLLFDRNIPLDRNQYDKLAIRYNQLIEKHETLELGAGVLLTRTFAPSCLKDPVHKITSSVLNWMMVEISQLRRLLLEYRNFRDGN